MTAYAVTGTVTPDCTVATTGEPAGEHNGQSYWTWETGGATWFLWYDSSLYSAWVISDELGQSPYTGHPGWIEPGAGIEWQYTPFYGAVGEATVAVYVPAVTTYILLQVSDGPNAGKQIILQTG